MRPPASAYRRSAFSLVELLAVIVVIGIVMTLAVSAVGQFGRSTGLVTGGNLVANLAAFARQNSMTKSTLTALVLLGEHGSEDDYRTLTVLEYRRTEGWAQVTPWQKLPTGVVVDRFGESDAKDPDNGTFLKYPTAFPFLTGPYPTQKNAPVFHEGKQVTKYAARIFTASGSLQNPQTPAQLRLVEGQTEGGQMRYTRPGAGGRAANYYDIALIGATGLARVDRP